MKGRIVVLDRIDDRAAAAMIVDGKVEDLLIDPPERFGYQPGAILRGRMDRPLKGQGGAILRLAGGQTGFLRGSKGIGDGATVLVQVSGVAEPGKAIPVTTRLLFKSRYAIVTPDAPGLNIARSIRDEELRGHLRIMAEDAMEGAGEGVGLILRSAASEANEDALLNDILAMRSLCETVMSDASREPELLVDAPDAHEQAWRDWAMPAPDAIDDSNGAFDQFGVLDTIEQIKSERWSLGAGASMFVETTRALIAIDVNTGADNSPSAGLKANLAAAKSLPLALRLSGLGGQIVVDFAPMPKKDRRKLEDAMKAAFRRDGAEAAMAGWTPLGNFEMQRKRDRVSLREVV